MENERFNQRDRDMIIQALRETDSYRHAGVFGQLVVEVARYLGRNPIQDMERLLREIKSPTYFLAQVLEKPSMYEARMPHDFSQRNSYGLYVAVNGEDEASQLMVEFGTNEYTNFERLADTGMRVLKPGEEEKMKSGFN